MYPASMTKIMTALIISESASPDEIMTVSQSALAITEPRSANIALVVGEEITVADALYALMLPSANDAANVLAEHVAGGQHTFANMMTERARRIGATNTRFENSHGLHEPGHFTTAYDMALITRHAMQNTEFMRYFGAARHTMDPTNLQPEPRNFTNFQHMLVPGTHWYHPDVTGGKVGFTHPARHTMSSSATRDGRTLIAVVMYSYNSWEKFQDTAALFEYGFDNFTPFTLEAGLFDIIDIPAIQDGNQVGNVSFYQPDDVTLLLPAGTDPNNLIIRYLYPDRFEVINERPTGLAIVELETGDGIFQELLTLGMRHEIIIYEPSQPVFGGELTQVGSRILAIIPAWLFRSILWGVVIFAALFVFVLVLRGVSIRKRRRARMARLEKARSASLNPSPASFRSSSTYQLDNRYKKNSRRL